MKLRTYLVILVLICIAWLVVFEDTGTSQGDSNGFVVDEGIYMEYRQVKYGQSRIQENQLF